MSCFVVKLGDDCVIKGKIGFVANQIVCTFLINNVIILVGRFR